MPSLKDYRDRIASVKSTRKITSAMKMVAASKLKKAQEQAEASQPYASAMAGMMARVAANVPANGGPKLLVGTGNDQSHLMIVVTADRGLCGGFNSNLVRKVSQDLLALEKEGKSVKLVCVGRKGYDVLKREYSSRIVKYFTGIGSNKGRISFAEADEVAQFVLHEFGEDGFDVCNLYYNQFKSVLTQTPSSQQLIPFSAPEEDLNEEEESSSEVEELHYDFEPDEQEIMELLLPKNLGIQIFRSLLDSAAGEQAARMTAMDNATRNAGDMINNLTLKYNRARQAYITKELIEIISGAEAV
jgi:F-type H+-transporting ATPase subunit gamma